MQVMRGLLFFLIGLLSTVLVSFQTSALPVADYLPKAQRYNADIPTPKQVLGVEIGERHLMHYQVLQYMSALAERSPNMIKTSIGRTAQHREQILLTISSQQNLDNLSQILARRNDVSKVNENDPLVVWLGYSVHGDEISGTHASLAVAYHLTASQSPEVKALLDNTIIVIEPSLNPDGMDRFAQWVMTYRNTSDNIDPYHSEHNQGWVSGRTNHFWFDLNRDWLLLSQQETRNRIKYFYQYQPNVLGDFHEMGRNSTYFFQPGIPTRTHPLTLKKNTELTQEIAKFHAAALDGRDRLYVSEENFDDFYYGKGSTYPDINGGVGILFEQASSRGYQVDTINGLLTFEFGIQNQVLTSLSTLAGASANSKALKQYRYDFYQQGEQQASKEKISGYLVHEGHDNFRMADFLGKLKQHRVEAYPLTSDYRLNDKVYSKATSYFIPLEQKQYRVVKALFTTETDFQDNTFYDVSGWTLPYAMNIEFQPITRTWGLKWSEQAWQSAPTETVELDQNAYAYAFEWHHFLAPKLLNKLLSQGIKARVTTKAFTSVLAVDSKDFALGTIVIPAGIQTEQNWRDLVASAATEAGIEIFNISTGLTPKGADLGSRTLLPIEPVKVLLVGGNGVSQYEAGEIRFYLDQMQGIPVSLVEKSRLARVNLADYSHIVMVNGNYSDLSKKTVNKLTNWVRAGGVLFGQKSAGKWLAEQEILKANFVSKKRIDEMFATETLTYQDKESLAARKRIAGAIYGTTLDTSHPLAYGYTEQNLPLFKNSSLIFEKPNSPFVGVAQYTASPLLSGYSDRNLVNQVANNVALLGHNYGQGRVIASSDVLAFRGYWLGSAKLLANSLFFAKAFDAKAE